MATRMDITRGFQVEQPDLFIPWKISPSQLQRIFDGGALRRVGQDYFTTSCTSLGGLSHELGFHFHRLFFGLFGPSRLMDLEFFRTSPPALAASYQEFQRHLEGTFGKPTRSFPGTEGFDTHLWELPGIRIGHSIYERFTVGQSVRITKL
ncbi:MAG TPA: hypothetical protein VGI63_10005 [Verrucomicrobiae bacterium]